MVLLYLIILTIVVLIALEGYDATMRLIVYIDTRIRYQIILLRTWFFKKQLELQLKKDTTEYKRLLEEHKNV